jgi:hypothetical protein
MLFESYGYLKCNTQKMRIIRYSNTSTIFKVVDIMNSPDNNKILFDSVKYGITYRLEGNNFSKLDKKKI